jgi:hypothetical protein
MFGICDLLAKLIELKELSMVLRNAEIGDKGMYEFSKSLV